MSDERDFEEERYNQHILDDETELPPDLIVCPTCGDLAYVTEEHDEQRGYEEKARPIVVVELSCGHHIERRGTFSD